MTLRIRELVIRAEIGGENGSDTAPRQRRQYSDSSPMLKPDSMTLRFYEADFKKDNER